MKLHNLFALQTILCAVATFWVLGSELPPDVPNPIGADGKHDWAAMMFTTKAYQMEAFRLVLQEANNVAKELALCEQLPIRGEDATEAFIPQFGIAWVKKAVGTITTQNYCYSVSIDDKFCYLKKTHLAEECQKYQEQYTWPKRRMDTKEAYQLATQCLMAVSMDVKALNRDLHLIIKPDDDYIRSPPGKFVPVYDVTWCKKWKGIPGVDFSNPPKWDPVASVRLFAPTKTLLELRVEDPKYILRPPLVFTNLAYLLSQTNTPALPHVPAKQ